MTEPRAIALALEDEVLRETRRKGVVVWLDSYDHYTTFVDDLVRRNAAGALAVPVVAFRGSFLEMLLALEPYAAGQDAEPLLIHMPGFTEQTIRATPVLELYEAGTRFRKALDALVREVARGRVAPDEIDRFLAIPGLSLESADAWLAGHHAGTGLDALLEQMSLGVVVEELLGRNTFLAAHVTSDADCDALAGWLHRQTGMDEAWVRFYGSDPGGTRLANLSAAFGAWLLCVEYVHDLARAPFLAALQPLTQLTHPLVTACAQVVRDLRAKYPDRYAALADEVELHLHDELPAMRPEDLGRIDTFRAEEATILRAAIGALTAGNWDHAADWATARAGDQSFWLQRDQVRRFAWTLVAEAAALGQVLARHARPLGDARSLADAVERYTGGAFEVDRAHRRFAQRCVSLLEPTLPHYGDLREVTLRLRQLHRAWIDRLAGDFTKLCLECGFLPDRTLSQRMVFEDVVHPLVAGQQRVAYFLVDALRFDLAADLAEELKASGNEVELRARLAELPTITPVGMNAAVPVANDHRLVLDGSFTGFRNGEYTVRKPDDRARAAGQRSLGRTARLFTLAEVCESDATALKRKLGAEQLVIVHSREIDDAGEANLGLSTFDVTVRQLKAACNHLQAAGISHFVFTADHGFLLQDETTQTKTYGSRRDPSRRHVLADDARREDGLVNVSLGALGYTTAAGEPAPGYLLFREDTAVFATGVAGATFVHGGNSLEERVVPVLTVGRKRAVAAGVAAYAVEARPESDVLKMRRLSVRLVTAPGALLLPLGTPEPVDLALRVPGRHDVVVTIKDAPGVVVTGDRVRVPVRPEWTEVFFTLEGPADERARVEVFHPDVTGTVKPAVLEAWFEVTGRVAAAGHMSVTTALWEDGFSDENVRRVFKHLEHHGSITEPEVTQMLGSPRAFRRFSVEFETHLTKVPFRVRIESAPAGKRYVREGDV